MAKKLTLDLLKKIEKEYGSSFYVLDSDVFEDDCRELLCAFKTYYPKSNIAYSYKTNYIPDLVKIVDRLGGYAEVVSEMEMEVAIKAGVHPERIIWNGPVKNEDRVAELLLMGGTVNLDSIFEVDKVVELARQHVECLLNIGLRLNYDVGDGVLSRFGFDVEGEEFDEALRRLSSLDNIKLVNLQAHFAKRMPEYWASRAEGMIKTYDKIVEKYGLVPKRLDIGGGIYGYMPDDFRTQLNIEKYCFDDYASRAATLFAKRFDEDGPWLFIEPGTAVAANSMRYVAQVQTIKSIRGKMIATTNGSQKNISMSGLNPPLEVIPFSKERAQYENLDIAGYTCIESDYLYKGYTGTIGVGDYLIFSCCGSYSIGMKPPFILPNVAVIDVSGDNIKLVKRSETFDDLFHTYNF